MAAVVVAVTVVHVPQAFSKINEAVVEVVVVVVVGVIVVVVVVVAVLGPGGVNAPSSGLKGVD